MTPTCTLSGWDKLPTLISCPQRRIFTDAVGERVPCAKLLLAHTLDANAMTIACIEREPSVTPSPQCAGRGWYA